jgi:hypothetical protein
MGDGDQFRGFALVNWRRLNKVRYNPLFSIKGRESQNFAHPNSETVDSLFAIIHLDIEITVRPPSSSSLTQYGIKSYVFEELFCLEKRLLKAEALSLSRNPFRHPHEIDASVGWRTEG